jgi:membrane associated rhomboid family serine protease
MLSLRFATAQSPSPPVAKLRREAPGFFAEAKRRKKLGELSMRKGVDVRTTKRADHSNAACGAASRMGCSSRVGFERDPGGLAAADGAARGCERARSGAGLASRATRGRVTPSPPDSTLRSAVAPGPAFGARPATTGLIVACTLVFVACLIGFAMRSDEPLRAVFRSLWTLDDPELLTEVGALAAARVWLDGEWWRVASAGLLHGSWLHLGLNMLGLWTVGQWTEKVWGWWRQLVLMVVSSIGGCLASLAWAEAPLVVGASAGIFGVAGALVVARAWGSDEIRDALAPVSAGTLGFWLVFWLAVGALLPLLFGFSLLAQAGHIGGLAFGCLMGFGFSRRKEQRGTRAACGALVGLGLGAAAYASSAPTLRPNYPLMMGAELLARGDYSRAVEQFELALAVTPEDQKKAEAKNAIAYSLAEAGVELERADLLVGEALEVEPGNSDYLDTVGWIRCQQGRVEAAAVYLRLAGAFAEMAERETPEIQLHLETCAEVAVPRGTGGSQ